MNDPLEILGRWLDEVESGQVPTPKGMTLVTATEDGRPSARIVSLKRLEDDALVFTTALWTRKVQELRSNPQVSALFHWPSLGRQVQIEGRAEIADRALAEELFAARPRNHQLQTLVSRQGEALDDLDQLRARLDALTRAWEGQSITCPPEWGAVRVIPRRIEFWEERADRLHERLLYEAADGGWRQLRLAP
jgi:pyridoxamine 5'-phosphate oxidase